MLADTEDIWSELFKQAGKQYTDPTLVLYRDRVASACGGASAASGPFYCPNDSKLYIDLSFYEELQNKLNAPGDFAMAYVVAHEVGHHIQALDGTAQKISQLRAQASEQEANRYSVMLELQADFYAGVWAHYEQQKKDPAIRKKNHDQLRRTSEDPKLARAFLLRSSLFDSLREAEQIV